MIALDGTAVVMDFVQIYLMVIYVNVTQDTLAMIVRQVGTVFEIFCQLIECKFHVRLPIPIDYTHICYLL